MDMSGDYKIPAPRAKVWAALNDPAVLKASIPGCQSLEKTSETQMTAKVRSKIGPVSATFTGTVTLSNIDPPNGYSITGQGNGGVAGFASGSADVSLKEDGPDATDLHYSAKAQVGGKLAQIGGRLIDATAKQMADEFFGAFAAKVGGVPVKEVEVFPPGADEALHKPVAADLIRDPELTAEAIEEGAEAAAARGFLGGPYMWGILALMVVIVLILIFR